MKGRLAHFDGLRACAVLAVMAFHIDLGFGDGGYFGVDVFFVLSGFLITGVLLGEWQAHGTISLRRFYARRFLRLYPALIVLLVVLTPLGHSLATSWAHWARAAALAGTYTSDLLVFPRGNALFTDLNALGPTWTLAVEEQFYLLWPLALIALLHRGWTGTRTAAVVVVVAVALLAFAPLVAPGELDAKVYFRPDFRFGELLLGCTLALVLAGRDGVPARVSRVLSVATPLALAGIAIACWQLPNILTATPREIGGWTVVVAACATVLVGRLATAPTGWTARVLATPPLPQIGLISYGMYLWHYPLLRILDPGFDRHGIPDAARVVVFYGATIAVATASYLIVERPFLRYKSRLRSTPLATARIPTTRLAVVNAPPARAAATNASSSSGS